MRKANKLLALALCVGLSVSVLGGCSSSGKGSDKKETKKEETKTETKSETDLVIKDAASYVDVVDYSTVKLKKKEIDKQVQEKIEEALEAHVSYEKIKKGKVKKGDTVNIYYVGRIDGEAFNGGSCTKDTYPSGFDLTIGSNAFIEGFEDGLIGKTIGKTYDVEATFPEEYQQNQELAGKKAVFTVTLNHKRGKKLKSEFNDEFVKTNLTSYKSVKDFKKQNRKSIIRSMALQKVCEASTVNKYPEDKVSDMETQLKTSIENYLKQSNMTLETYLSSQKMTEEDYKKQITETAKSDIGNQLVYQAIAQAEKLEVKDEDYQKELQTYLTNYGAKTEEDLNKTFQTNYGTTAKNIIWNDLLFGLVSDFLVDKVKEV